MNSDGPILEVESVGKRFCAKLRRSLRYGLADVLSELVGRPPPEQLRADEFWALKGISLRLDRGTCIGLIGPNGAGKSTLLKLIAGILKPDRGRIVVRGRTGALIELGAGIHPLLSGRENVHLLATILGLSRAETTERIETIIDFAGLGDFIDAPTQSYSTGMRVRLGFSVAAHLDPDLLLVDEVLAVGDAAFRARCYERIDQLRERAAIVLVSHNDQHIARLCDRVLWLERGRERYQGSANEGLVEYANTRPLTESFRRGMGVTVKCTVVRQSRRQLSLAFRVDQAAPPKPTRLTLFVLSPDLMPLLAFRESEPPHGVTFHRSIDLTPLNLPHAFLSVVLHDEKGAMLSWHHAFEKLDIGDCDLSVGAPLVAPFLPAALETPDEG